MSCNIKINDNGKYIVKADNGQPSILFRHLKASLNNDRAALEKWAVTRTPEFNARFSKDNIYLDMNGEPSMLYVDPQNDFLYYGKKDKEASAKAKDTINRADDLKKIEEEFKNQAEIVKNTILKDIAQFRVAEAQGSRTNRYSDLSKSMAGSLKQNDDAVKAIMNFTAWGSYNLNQARQVLNKLAEDKGDTNSHLEALNELGQLLVIFNNLTSFKILTGNYEKTFFQVQMEEFFKEMGVTPNREMNVSIKYYKGEAELFKIQKELKNEVKKLNISDKEKQFILDKFDKLIEDKPKLTSVLDDLFREKDILEGKLKAEYYNAVTDWLYPYYDEQQKNASPDLRLSWEDFRNQLKKAQKDVGLAEYTLTSLSTVNDPVAQAIRLAAEQDRHNAHLETVQGMSRMSKALKDQFNNQGIELSQYDKYLKTVERKVRATDEDGNPIFKTLKTKALITPYLTERLEEDRNVEFQRQTEYYTKIEDDKISKLEALIRVEGLSDKKREDALNRYEKAKEEKDFNIIKARSKAMNAWYETKYDVVPSKQDLINRKKIQLSKDEFKIWYESQIFKRVLTPEELEYHKKNKRNFRVIHPDNIYDQEITNDSYYKAGRSVKGKVQEYYVYEIFYGGEFTTPKKEYIDPKFYDLVDDKFFMELRETYNEANNKLSGRHKLKHGIVPQIEKGGSFFKSDLSAGENAKRLWKNLTPDIYAESNEYEIEQDGVMMKVSKVTQNVDGTTIKTIPVKFVSILDNMEDLDTNLIETISKFSAVTNRYAAMSRTEASARAIKNLITGNPQLGIDAREIVLTDAKGNPVLQNIKDKLADKLNFAVKDKDFRLNRLMVDFIDDIWYGDIEEKDSINIFGKEISKNKLSNFTSKWVSIQRLAGNLDSAISNLVIGKLSIFNEAVAGRFYNLSQFYEASKIINTELFDGTIIKDYMQEDINQKSLYAQMMIRHDAIQGEFSNEYGIKISKKTAAEMGKDFLFFSQNGMEYSIQKRSMLCVSQGFKIQLPKGMIYDRTLDELRPATDIELRASQESKGLIETKYKALIEKQKEALRLETEKKPTDKLEIQRVAANISKINKDLENISKRKEEELSKVNDNYFTALDAYTRETDPNTNEMGAIKVKDFLKPYFGNKEENQLRRRIQELNKRQQGIYAQFDKSQAQRHWLGKLALMFRKYLYSAYEHRFGDRIFNAALGEETYGYQRQFINKFLADFKTYGTWAFSKLMDGSASPAEQYAINKTLTEYAVWASFLVLFWLMKAIADDDDEESFAFSKTQYIVKRTEDSLSEFALPFGIGTLVRTFKNPISSITLVEQIYEVFAVVFDDPWNFGGEYQRDSGLNEKGDSKFLGKLFKVSPILRQYGKFMTPDEQLKYYTQKKTNL